MTDTRRVIALRAHCVDIAKPLREIGLALDRAPRRIDPWIDQPAVALMSGCGIPTEHLAEPYAIDGEVYDMTSCLEHTVAIEELSYGDAGFVLSCPGPLMSGVTVAALGDEQQRHDYFDRVAVRPTWTFFALTEPAKGSAAAELETRLVPDGDDFVLHGEKRWVGNAAYSQLGVVFARRAPGPLGIEAVLVDTSAPGFHAETIPLVGLRGSAISAITFDGVRVPREQVLGLDRRPTRRGLIGAIKTFQRFRPVLAGMVLGVARAALDHVADVRPTLTRWGRLRLAEARDRVELARRRTYAVAADVDAGTVRADHVAAVKVAATELAEDATRLAADLLGPASLLTDPLLDKLYRDARGFEFMEGTGNIQRLAVFQGVLNGGYPGVSAS
ncbi:acyl-CoA dehydrogenase family protein [Actinosynnema sp. CA-299493]